MRFTLAPGPCEASWYVPLARAAEATGWDSLTVPDGLFYHRQTSAPYPYTVDGSRPWGPEAPFLDPWSLIGALAAVTERLTFYPAVLKLAVRDPLLVAKQLASCAVLSGDRVALGVGLSPTPEDFDVLGREWSHRGPRSAEMIEVIRGLLRGGMFEFHGHFYDVPALQIAPVPRYPVPIYVGGFAEPVLRRAARIADGYIGWEHPLYDMTQLAASIRRMERYRADYGRDGAAFEYKFMTRSADEAMRRQLADAGVTDMVCTPWIPNDGPDAGLDARLDAIRRFADQVIARAR